jgi:hypothetical protein
MCRPGDYPPYDSLHDVRRRAADRERKRLVQEREQRMGGDRRTQHIRNAILKRLKVVR